MYTVRPHTSPCFSGEVNLCYPLCLLTPSACRLAGLVLLLLLLVVGCLASPQHASISQGRICSHNCTHCHTEIEDANQTFYLTQSQYTDTGPIRPYDARRLARWPLEYQSYVPGMTDLERRSTAKTGIEPRSASLEADALPQGQRGGLRGPSGKASTSGAGDTGADSRFPT